MSIEIINVTSIFEAYVKSNEFTLSSEDSIEETQPEPVSLLEIEREIATGLTSEEKQFANPGGKFNSIRQVARHWERLCRIPKEEAQKIFEEELKADLLGVQLEIINELPILKPEIAIDGETNDLYCPNYNNANLIELSMEVYEREGAVVTALHEIQNNLKTANPGDYFLFTSPPGWHGMKSIDGLEQRPHEESQTWLYYMDENKKLRSATIRTDMTAEQSADFLKSINENIKFNKNLSEKQLLINVTQAVVNGKAESFEQAGEYIVRKMESIMDQKYAFENKRTGNRFTFDELAERVINLDAQTFIEKNIQEIINETCKEFCYIDIKSREDLKSLILGISENIYKMMIVTEGITGKDKKEIIKKATKSFEDRKGCPSVSTSKVEKKYINGVLHYLVSNCWKCNAPINKFLKKGDKCPHCGIVQGC